MSEVTTYGTAEPVRLPRRMTRGEEFLHLMDAKARIEVRLNELAEFFSDHPADAPRLPKSGLRLVAGKSGSLTFKGRQHNG